MFKTYGKALAAVVGAALIVVQTAVGDGRIDAQEWVQIAIAAATAVGVYVVPLAPQYRWGKTAVAVVLAVLQVLTTVVLGGLDTQEVVTLLITALTAAGVAGMSAVSGDGTSSKPSAPRSA